MSDWIPQDDGQGNTYYYNQVTGESSWDVPDGFDAGTTTTTDAENGGWIPQDDGQGNEYYYNTVTGESSWDKPTELMSEEERAAAPAEKEDDSAGYTKWSAMFDPASNAYYYYNNFTGETTWDKPDDYQEPDEGKKFKLPPHLSAALKIQAVFRAKKAKKMMLAKRGANASKNNPGGELWTPVLDPASNEYYYFNNDTQECVWEKPDELLTPEERDSKAAAANVEPDPMNLPEWVEIFDPSSKAYYFYNNHTGEQSWDKPEGYKPIDTTQLRFMMAPEVRAALTIQGAFRMRQARRGLRAARGEMLSEPGIAWVPVLDPGSKEYYYYNNETGEQTWDKPEELMTDFEKKTKAAAANAQPDTMDLPEWVEIFDPSSKSYYFYNNHTGEQSWDKPVGYKPTDTTQLRFMMAPEVRAALIIQGAYRMRQARRGLRAARGKMLSEPGREWTPIFDEASGETYYYNSETGEETWDKPEVLQTDEEKLAKEDEANLPEWIEVYDPSSKAYYFYNNWTGEQSWDKPEGYKPVDMTQLRFMMAPEVRAALAIQGAYRMKQARAGLRAARGKMLFEPGANSAWTEVWDDGCQAHYYYNYETEETVWVKPEELMTEEEKEAKEAEKNMPEWIDVWDPAQSTFYYYNNFTGEITWDKPEGYTRPNKTTLRFMMKPELRAALCIQGIWRAKLARRDVRAQRGAVNATGGEIWQEILDPGSESYYYYNNETGDVTWEKPAELMTEEEKINAEAAANMPEWIDVWDPGQSTFYYYNQFTGDITWDKPEGYKRPNKASLRFMMKPELRAALCIQGIWRAKLARRDVRAQRGAAGAVDGQLWQEIFDPASGLNYYYNNETGDVTWEKPEELMTEEEKAAATITLPEWMDVWDPAQSTFYYYNQYTGEVVWDKPEGFKRADYSKMKLLMKPELRAALTIQGIWRAKLARRDVRAQRGAAGAVEGQLWQELLDPASQLNYYYNNETGEVTWEKPKELMTEEEKAAMDVPLWMEAFDAGTGMSYYYNTQTSEVVWDEPPGFDRNQKSSKDAATQKMMKAALEGKLKSYDAETLKQMKAAKEAQAAAKLAQTRRWVEVYSEEHDAFYYFDADDPSQEVTWTKPADYIMSTSDELLAAAIKIQNVFRAKVARGEIRVKRAQNAAAGAGTVWVAVMDPGTGMEYYYHTTTMEVTWEKPRELWTAEELAQGGIGAALGASMAANMQQSQQSAYLAMLNSEEMEMKREMERLEEEKEMRKIEKRKKKRLEAERIEEELGNEKKRIAREEDNKRREEVIRERARRKAVKESEAQLRIAAKQSKLERAAQRKLEREAKAKFAEEAAARRREEERVRVRTAYVAKLAALRGAETAKLNEIIAAHPVKVENMRQVINKTREYFTAVDGKSLRIAAKVERGATSRKQLTEAAYNTIWEAVRRGASEERLLQLFDDAVAIQNPNDGKNPANPCFNINDRNEAGETLLHLASWNGQADAVRLLLMKGANPRIIDSGLSRSTPLHEAARGGFGAVAELLLQAGAGVDAKDLHGDNPLHLAARGGFNHVARIILQHDPDLRAFRAKNDKGRTPGDLAVKKGKSGILRLFQCYDEKLEGRRYRADAAKRTADAKAGTGKKKLLKVRGALTRKLKFGKIMKDADGDPLT